MLRRNQKRGGDCKARKTGQGKGRSGKNRRWSGAGLRGGAERGWGGEEGRSGEKGWGGARRWSGARRGGEGWSREVELGWGERGGTRQRRAGRGSEVERGG